MSCGICNGYPGCPCCSAEPHLITCPECNGKGYFYYNGDGDEITADQYRSLPVDKRDEEACEECNGTGEIKYEYEPDYDGYDE